MVISPEVTAQVVRSLNERSGKNIRRSGGLAEGPSMSPCCLPSIADISIGSVEESHYYLTSTGYFDYSDVPELKAVLAEASKFLEAYSQGILNSDS